MSKEQDNFFRWSIIGHRNVVSYLQNNLKNLHTAHAYLFVGPAHVGKSTIAKDFVTSLVCRNLHNESFLVPCGECDCCKQIANNIHPDVYWISRETNEKTGKLKKNISIEQIRELQNKLNLHSFLDSYKVAIVEEAQTLSQEAANSLLKTLEEPTQKTVIILLATNISLLPQTIVSRCRVIKFLPVDPKDIFDYLVSLKVDRKKAKTLTALSFGRPGIALDYFFQSQEYADFEEQVQQFITLMKASSNQRFQIVNELVESNDIDQVKNILLIWIKVIRDLLLIKNGLENSISNLNISAELEQLAKSYQSNNLIGGLNRIGLAKRYLDANVNPRLTLENLVLNF
ncbi:MAG: AAA family ATPase [Patescibacteria group bacterium]